MYLSQNNEIIHKASDYATLNGATQLAVHTDD